MRNALCRGGPVRNALCHVGGALCHGGPVLNALCYREGGCAQRVCNALCHRVLGGFEPL